MLSPPGMNHARDIHSRWSAINMKMLAAEGRHGWHTAAEKNTRRDSLSACSQSVCQPTHSQSVSPLTVSPAPRLAHVVLQWRSEHHSTRWSQDPVWLSGEHGQHGQPSICGTRVASFLSTQGTKASPQFQCMWVAMTVREEASFTLVHIRKETLLHHWSVRTHSSPAGQQRSETLSHPGVGATLAPWPVHQGHAPALSGVVVIASTPFVHLCIERLGYSRQVLGGVLLLWRSLQQTTTRLCAYTDNLQYLHTYPHSTGFIQRITLYSFLNNQSHSTDTNSPSLVSMLPSLYTFLYKYPYSTALYKHPQSMGFLLFFFLFDIQILTLNSFHINTYTPFLHKKMNT